MPDASGNYELHTSAGFVPAAKTRWRTYTVVASMAIPVRAESIDDAIGRVRALSLGSLQQFGQMVSDGMVTFFVPQDDPDFNPELLAPNGHVLGCHCRYDGTIECR